MQLKRIRIPAFRNLRDLDIPFASHLLPAAGARGDAQARPIRSHALIGQNGTGERVQWSGRDVIEVRFEMVRDTGRLGWLELDNVTFY